MTEFLVPARSSYGGDGEIAGNIAGGFSLFCEGGRNGFINVQLRRVKVKGEEELLA